MRYLRNEDGIALMTALMFTLLCLGMIMTLLYYVISGIRMSGGQKSYRNTLEASYGGTDFVTKSIVPRLFNNYSAGKVALLTDFGPTNKLGLAFTSDSLKTKLTTRTDSWGSLSKTVNPKDVPDMTFTVKGATSSSDFKVFTKIVDTVEGVGLIDSSGIDYLGSGAGVTGSSSAVSTPRTPNIYTVEVQGEKVTNPKEKASLTALYAY